jgi:hypothetical protein
MDSTLIPLSATPKAAPRPSLPVKVADAGTTVVSPASSGAVPIDAGEPDAFAAP